MKKILTILLLLIFTITSIPIAEAKQGYHGRKQTHVRGYRRGNKWVNSHYSHTYKSRPKRSCKSRKRSSSGHKRRRRH